MCGGYVIGTICGSWFGFLPLPFQSLILKYHFIFEGNDYIFACGIFYGIIFVAIGGFIAEYQLFICFSKAVAGFTIPFIFQMLEAILINNNGNAYGDRTVLFLMLVSSALLFLLILNIMLADNALYLKMRKYSTLIYLVYCVVIRITNIIRALFDIRINHVLHFVCILAF